MTTLASKAIRTLAKWISPLLHEDKSVKAGVGPFSLPPDHPFHRIARFHDFSFSEARYNKENSYYTLWESDEGLFRGMAYLAINAPTLEEKIKLMEDVCYYWPIARSAGYSLWEGKND